MDQPKVAAEAKAGQPSQRVVPTLDSLSPGQIESIRRLRPIDETPIRTDEARRPVGIFVDPAHYALEQRAIFRRLPVPVALSVQLPEPNMFLALESYGVPLLLSRTVKGEIKAFLNVCQHKGSKLVERTDAFKGGRVSCPYHAWTFSGDGRLVGVPREEVFPSLRKEDHGLASLACQEAGGFIWVVLDRDSQPDFSHITADILADLDALKMSSLHLFGHKTFELDANWKLVIEPFLEPYHVQRLHSRTVAGFFGDVPCTIDRLGDHLRQVSGRTNYTPSMLDDGARENIHKIISQSLTVFPSTVIVTSPYYISVMIIQPRAANRSKVEYFMLTREPADNEKAQDLFSRSYEMILSVFGNEDFRAACLSQEGLESGALKEVLYGGMEAAIPMFYEVVERHLNSAAKHQN